MVKVREFIKNFLIEHTSWIIFSMLLFCAGFFVGFGLAIIFPPIFNSLMTMLQSTLGKEINSFADQKDIQTMYLIWKRNIQSSLIISFGGILFGILSFIGIFVNGFIVGILSGAFTINGQIGTLLVSIIPHGIVEIPVLIVTGAVGLHLGLDWILDKHKGKRVRTLVLNIKAAILYIPYLLVLLLIAAMLEVFVTGKIVQLIH